MIEVKTFGGGLNLDDSLYKVNPNDYIQALNITHDAIEGSNDNDITNVVANRVADNTYSLPAGVNMVIGAIANTLRNSIIDFRWNSNNFHRISLFDATTRLYTTILENLTDTGGIDILGFTEHDKITSINIYNREEGDLLYYLDSLGRPSEIDIPLIRSYIPVTRDIIDKARKPNLSPPNVIFVNDTTKRSNNFRKRLMRFKTRLLYKSLEKSSFSPISEIPLPKSILSDIFTNVVTNNNVIQITANTGDKSVKSVEIGMSYVEATNNWSDFVSIVVIDKASLILNQTTNTVTNESTYTSFTTFLGLPVEGDIINVYLKSISGASILAGTYEVLVSDSLTNIATGVATGLISGGLATGAISTDNETIYSFNKGLYTFDRVDILPSVTSSIDNRDFTYLFYNDGVYANIDIEESIQLQDKIPDVAGAQEMPNGNTIAYGDITEGYDKNTKANSVITILTIPATNASGGGSFNSIRKIIEDIPDYQSDRYALSGIPVPGTVINIKVKKRSDSSVIVASTYTTVIGDNIYTIEALLASRVTAPDVTGGYGFGNVTFRIKKSTYQETDTTYFSLMEIIPPASSSINDSIPTFLWGGQKTIAREYFDIHGKTNGVLYYDKVTFPSYDENGSFVPLLPYINYKIYDVPPIWANSMTFSFSKEATILLVWQTISVNKDETEYIYLDITSVDINAKKKPTTATVLSYTFQEGDRVKLYRSSDNVVLSDTYDSAIEGFVTDPTINNVPKTGRYLKIKSVEPFTTGLDAAKNYVIEIYRPTQQVAEISATGENQTFFEVARQYYIIDAGLPTRRHSGEVTDQVLGSIPAEYNFYKGDFYFRQRTIAISEVGYSTFNVIDSNFVDFYISAVNNIDGRPLIIDINAKKSRYTTLIRFSQEYNANTNVNGLNRFYDKNSDQYDYSYGAIARLYVMDRFMRVFQRDKIGMVPLFSSLGKTGTGIDVVFNTDKLLNPIQYYKGNVGIGTAKESLAASNYANYGCDNIRGLIWRVSNDGVVILSLLYKVNSWATEFLPLQIGNNKIYGCYDQRLSNYVITLNSDLSVCAPVYVAGFTLPNAVLDMYYYYSVSLNGTPDFSIDNMVIPLWMSISLSGNVISFYGTPDTAGDDIPVTFDVFNQCGTISIIKTINIQEMETGDIILFGGIPASISSGWFLCDGSAKSRTTEAALFAVIGTLYGAGDGTTTFNIPNVGKKFIGGYDAGDANYNTVGFSSGNNSRSIVRANLPNVSIENGIADDFNITFVYGGTSTGAPGLATSNIAETAGGGTRQGLTSPLGSGTALDVTNSYVVIPYKIKR